MWKTDNPADYHREGLIHERRLQAVDGWLDLHSYGKEKNFGQVTM